jgi:hypothetical protein
MSARSLFARIFSPAAEPPAPAEITEAPVAKAPALSELEKQSLAEIPHPSPPEGSSLYGGTKVFPDLEAGAGGTVYCCRFGLSLHGLREEDLIAGVIPTHPLDVQDALIHYARKGAVINSTYQL